ncbi:MBL fold metallo-hydrolase [Ottowia sp. SB7-C50]|uniref:MBL fold metallo-hydrolase n=1 Tax=Ottowia sp. SB7-C50 TaxID=3081231 RepID=UPI002953B5EE|nr:MBL fold metallo-hydrolase [Ottowia sp. SB7-C50]WOP16266.1 MBL fold metallo-hydrolase [Ottowia sp. SB7-C50]
MMQSVIDRRQLLQRCLCVPLGGMAWARYSDAAAQPAALPDMTAREAAPGCWYVEGLSALGSPANQNFISNAGFIVTSAGVVVIDALGSPALAERLLAEIKKVTPQKVTHVIVTHYHADHVYGLQVFEQAGARIIAQQAGREYLHADTARLRLQASRTELAPWIDDKTRLVAATEWIDARREITVGDTRLVLQPVGPAHTPEDLAVYLPDKKVLYAGDLVFRSRVPFVGQADSRNWIKSLDKLLAFDADVVVPGHGPVSTEARKDMELTRNYLAYLRKTMGQAARDMTPFDEAYKATDWSAYEHLPLFGAANRMNAYNTYLLMEHDPE